MKCLGNVEDSQTSRWKSGEKSYGAGIFANHSPEFVLSFYVVVHVSVRWVLWKWERGDLKKKRQLDHDDDMLAKLVRLVRN